MRVDFALPAEWCTHNKTIKAPKSTCSQFCPTVLKEMAHVVQGMVTSPSYGSICLTGVSLYGPFSGAHGERASSVVAVTRSMRLSMSPTTHSHVFYGKDQRLHVSWRRPWGLRCAGKSAAHSGFLGDASRGKGVVPLKAELSPVVSPVGVCWAPALAIGTEDLLSRPTGL